MKQTEKKCAICGDTFYPYKTTQRVCSMKCFLEHQNAKIKKQVKKSVINETKGMEALTPSGWKQKFVTAFNSYIRERDKKKGCVSCDRSLINVKFDAGHFYASTYEGLRFNELNVHGQCKRCNQFKGSNNVEYRKRITNRITPDQLQWLDDHKYDELKLTIWEIKKLIDEYEQKTKDLKNAH